jgi:S-adenosylmethionine:tRNA ribosyltransferase-isomerase
MVSPSGNIQFTVSEKTEKSVSLYSKDFLSEEFFDKEGNVPIPPYLKRQSEELDSIRYQTIFAKNSGSVAAPTAGLHMSEGLRHNLLNQGVNFHPLNLEIGFGTFQPLSPENFQTKTLHKEKIHIPKDSILAHSLATKSGERRIAMGTTTLRALEAMVRSPEFSQYNGNLELVKDWDGETDLFLTHKDRIATIDGLITNFHLPKSSLLLLVSAFAGKELILEAYNVALEKNFNFFSYGDVMFII